MSVTNPRSVLQPLQWRYATKKFDPSRKIPPDHWRALEESLILAPSSYGLQPWRFVVVTDPAIKEQLPAISWNQPQPRDCSHFVLFAVRREMTEADAQKLIERTAQVRGGDVADLEGFKKMMVGSFAMIAQQGPDALRRWNADQAYIALGFLMHAAAVLGIDTCPMEGIITDKYDALFELDKLGYAAVVGCAVGYRAPDDKYATLPKIRYERSELFIDR